MTLVPEIRDELHRTARRRARAAGAPPRPAWRAGATAVAAGVSALVVVAVVAVVLTLHPGSHENVQVPGVGPGAEVPAGPPSGWSRLDLRALQQTQRADPACRPRRLRHAPLIGHGRPDRALTAELGVLRRPAPSGQRVTATQLRHVGSGGVGRFARGVYLRYVRRLQRAGVTFYVIPAANVTQTNPIPSRCDSERLAAFRAGARALPSARRRPAIAYEARYLRGQRREQAQLARDPSGACLLYVAAGFSGAGDCVDIPGLRALGSTPVGGGSGNDHVTVTARIVPDRVATVTARYSAQRDPGRVRRPVTVTHHVVDNLVTFVFRGAWDPPALTERSAGGSILLSTGRR